MKNSSTMIARRRNEKMSITTKPAINIIELYHSDMHKFHAGLLKQIKSKSRSLGDFNVQGYLGTTHKFYNLKTQDKRNIAKEFYKNNKDIGLNELVVLLDSLYKGKSFEEKTLASEILVLYKNYKSKIKISDLEDWVSQLEGWAELDSLCSQVFDFVDIEPILDKWEKWLCELSKSKNINLRRASLVFLVRPARQTDESRILNLSLENIEKLKQEKEVLITKAVSWLLRSLVKHHKSEVKKYVLENKETLPAIAVRETLKKIETGKK